LCITQPALTKRIKEIESLNRLRLFVHAKGRPVELTKAGRAFVEEARIALLHIERAIHLAQTVDSGSVPILKIGYSPGANPSWVSAILASRLSPPDANLRIRFSTRFALDLVRDVIVGDLNMALVTAPPEDTRLTAISFARAPLCAAIPESHRCVHNERLALRDLEKDDWILSAKQVHPMIYDAILKSAELAGIVEKDAHEVFTEEQAIHLVTEHAGVAILANPSLQGFRSDGVVVKPLSAPSLCFDTCLVLRSDDDTKVTNKFARSFLRSFPRLVSA
jgi:DNA-binding transcriptional LysR family regulator